MTRPQLTKPLLLILMASFIFAGGTSHADIASDLFTPQLDPTLSKQAAPRAYQPGDRQLQRHAEFNEIAQRGDTDLVFLGDSITQGWENAGKNVWTRYYSGRWTSGVHS